MQKLFIPFLLFISIKCYAQDSLQNLNFNRNHIKNTGMQVLGAWATANIVTGGIGWAVTSGKIKYFHQINALWNVANLGVAILGYANTIKDKDRIYTDQESLQEQNKLEKIFLVNGGLDLIYIGMGAYLVHRGNMNNSDQSKGYGSGIIMQGAFLLLFDTIMYTSEIHTGNKLRNFLLKNPVTFDGKKVGIVINL
ncbi:hypothetical protein FO440_16630 [Mucilaginibacter corticis]|uniref:Uncharacterized protein n=1 Tax=Mucilaginibacter corticis TaxID=2597670 RepID=A0A556MHM9_9SPHI|nr:hypothetical protein [Mucilaginibacter corticis]TSJ39373.1 hypothetical protein FO440_16630 [Mucilaginibacter corticis]